ncbi:hypothetical protein STEG23_028180 [Scotinomys teguina]
MLFRSWGYAVEGDYGIPGLSLLLFKSQLREKKPVTSAVGGVEEKGERFPHSLSSTDRTLVTWHTGVISLTLANCL